MPVCIVPLLVVMGLALPGCDGKPRAPKKPQTPEQVEASQCFLRVLEKSIQTNSELSERELKLMTSKESYVPITLARRRAKEEQCAEEARCLKLKDFEYSVYFDQCLRGDEKL